MKLVIIENENEVIKYSQLQDMTEEEVKNALQRGEMCFYLEHFYTGIAYPDEPLRYKVNVDNKTGDLILIDNLECTVALRGVEKISKFMIDNHFGLVTDIIALEKTK